MAQFSPESWLNSNRNGGSRRSDRWLKIARNIQHKIIVVPAYAGVIPARPLTDGVLSGGSRVCGGDPAAALFEVKQCRWFPRMRG